MPDDDRIDRCMNHGHDFSDWRWYRTARGPQRRHRCRWCGQIEIDMSHVIYIDEEDPK